MRKRAVVLPAAVAAGAALLSGCGAHGQPQALEACKVYTNVTTGLVSAHQRDVGLARAERWAGKAVDKGAQWQPLLDALRAYHHAVDASGPAAARRRSTASALIQNNCESAARGY